MTTKYICDLCGSSYGLEVAARSCEAKGKYIPYTEYPRGLMFEYHHHGFVGIFAIAEDTTYDSNQHLGVQSWWACRAANFNCGDSLGKSMCGGTGLQRNGELAKWKTFHKITPAYVGCPEYTRMVAFLSSQGITPTYYNELGELVTVEPNIFSVRSSQGEIIADLFSGVVLSCTPNEEANEYFTTIKRFDLPEQKKYRGEEITKGDSVDILDLGYWYHHNDKLEYEEPDHKWRELMVELSKK